jgi:pyrroloquinoline quinone biosynthesis protein E
MLQVHADPADGLSVLEQRKSQAATFGISVGRSCGTDSSLSAAMSLLFDPLELERNNAELTTGEWKRVLSELAEIGVLQIHFSGEATARKDLAELIRHATDVGLYTNLITSAVLLTKEKLIALVDAGLPYPDKLPR